MYMKNPSLLHILGRAVIFFAAMSFLLAVSAGVSAQSRVPSVSVGKIQAPKDSTGFEERPYFLLIEQSEQAVAEGKYHDAGLRLVEAMAMEPENPLNVALLSNLGMIYYYNEQDSMALVTLTEAVRRSPRLIAAHEYRARVLTGMGRDKEAYREYENVIALDSLNTTARFYHSMMALYGGDRETAEADIAVLNSVVPLWRNTMLANATLYSMTERNLEAVSLFRKLIEVEPMPEYYAAMAGCQIALDNLGDAAQTIGEGMDRYPNDPELYYYRAKLNKLRFMPNEAHRDAKRAIELGADRKKVAKIFE